MRCHCAVLFPLFTFHTAARSPFPARTRTTCCPRHLFGLLQLLLNTCTYHHARFFSRDLPRFCATERRTVHACRRVPRFLLRVTPAATVHMPRHAYSVHHTTFLPFHSPSSSTATAHLPCYVAWLFTCTYHYHMRFIFHRVSLPSSLPDYLLPHTVAATTGLLLRSIPTAFLPFFTTTPLSLPLYTATVYYHSVPFLILPFSTHYLPHYHLPRTPPLFTTILTYHSFTACPRTRDFVWITVGGLFAMPFHTRHRHRYRDALLHVVTAYF